MYKYALRYVFGFLVLFGAVGVQVSSADTLGPVCDGCGGVVYTLNVAPTGLPSGGMQKYDYTLQINTSGIENQYANEVLVGVALKAQGGTPSLIAPTSGWKLIPGGTNSGGCKMSTTNGFYCAGSTTGGVPVGPGDPTYTFVFEYLLPAGLTGDLANGVELKAVYDTTTGGFGGLQTSDTFGSPAPVPEPGTLTLLGAGLVAAGLILKRR